MPRGGRALRRGPRRRSRRCSTSAARVQGDDASRTATAGNASRRAAGAHGLRRRRHEPEHDLREGAPGHLRARQAEAFFAPHTATRQRRRSVDARAAIRSGFFTSATTRTGTPSASTATTTRTTRAASSRRWRRRKDGFRTWPRSSARRRDAGAERSRRASRRWRDARRAARRRARARRWCAVNRLTPTIVEVVVRAPLAARKFQPGQFYRLQNFESDAPRRRRHAPRDGGPRAHRRLDRPEKGLLSLIVLEMGGSSRLCAALKPGEPVVVMGPTGTPTEIPDGRDGAARRRRPRQRGALLDRQGAARGAAARSSTSPATQGARTSSSRTTSRRPPTRSSGRPTRRRDRAAPAAGRAFVGNIVQAMRGLRRGRARRADGAARRGGSASSPSAPTA